MGTFSKIIAKLAPFFVNYGWIGKIYFFENPEVTVYGSSKKDMRHKLRRSKPQKSAFSRRGVRSH